MHAMSDTLTDVAEDHSLRRWTFTGTARVKIGSDAHKHMFCRMLLETHDPYKPAVVDWPALSPDALERLCSLPIWDIAVQTEGRASINVHTYAAQLSDPLLREAITMDGDEEARHKRVLAKLIAAYGIEIAPSRTIPRRAIPNGHRCAPATASASTVSSRSASFAPRGSRAIFPKPSSKRSSPQFRKRRATFCFSSTGSRGIDIPCRYRAGRGTRLRVTAIWAVLIWERLAIAKGIDANGVARDSNFLPANSSVIGKGLETPELIELCLAQNERRMSGYDARLLRPRLVPALARFALRSIKRSRRTDTER